MEIFDVAVGLSDAEWIPVDEILALRELGRGFDIHRFIERPYLKAWHITCHFLVVDVEVCRDRVPDDPSAVLKICIKVRRESQFSLQCTMQSLLKQASFNLIKCHISPCLTQKEA